MDQFVEEDPQGPHIDLVIVRDLLDHLRRHIFECAEESLPLGLAVAGRLFYASAKIAYL